MPAHLMSDLGLVTTVVYATAATTSIIMIFYTQIEIYVNYKLFRIKQLVF